MKMKLVLVDDDIANRQTLLKLLDFYNIFELVAEFEDVNEANIFICAHEIDVVFINKNVGNPEFSGDGSYLAVNIRENCPDTMIVVYTNDTQFAYNAFQYRCTDFLSMPFRIEDMQRVVGHLTYLWELFEFKRESVNKSIMVKTKNGYQLIKVVDILFIERSNRKNKIVTLDGKEIFLAGYSMDEIEKLVSGASFYRCYQSFIVNLEKVSFIRVNSEAKNYALLFDGYAGEVILSRDKYAEVVQILKDKYVKISM